MIPEGVTRIEPTTFSDCRDLEWVTLSVSLTVIDWRAFNNSPKLKRMTLPENLTTLNTEAFDGILLKVSPRNPNFYTDNRGVLIDKRQKKLIVSPRSLARKYEIPKEVTAIEAEAFRFCTEKITSVVIHKDVTSIGDVAFFGVKEVEVAEENPNFFLDDCGILIDKVQRRLVYAPQTLAGEYIVPEGMLIIGARTFQNCKNLLHINFPEDMQAIGNFAFCGCVGLKQVILPDSITYIGSHTFFGCNKLHEVKLSANLEWVEAETFNACRSLKTIKLSPKVKYIGRLAFCGTGLKEVEFPNRVIMNLFRGDAFVGCGNLRRLSLPAHFQNFGLPDLPPGCQIVLRKK